MEVNTATQNPPVMGEAILKAYQEARDIKAAGGRKKPGSAPAKVTTHRSIAEIEASRRERKAFLEAKAVETPEQVLELYIDLLDDEARLSANLTLLDAGMRDKLVTAGMANEAIQATQEALVQVRADLASISSDEFPSVVEHAIVRQRVRKDAKTLGKLCRDLDPGNTRPDVVTEMIRDDVGHDLICESESGPIAWGDRRYAAKYADAAIDEFVNSLVSFLKAFKAVSEARKSEYYDEASKYLIPTEHIDNPNCACFNCLKDAGDTMRSLQAFISEEGERCFVPVEGTDRQSGQPRFYGEAMLERSEGRVICRKVGALKFVPSKLAHMLFFYFDKRQDKRVEKGQLTLNIRIRDGEADVSRVEPNILRSAMEAKLKRDAEAAKRRGEADDLRDISKLENPGSFADLRAGSKVTTPVSILWRTMQKRGAREVEVEVPVTIHLRGDGEGNFFISDSVEGTLDKVSWLRKHETPTPVDELDREKKWRVVRGLNLRFERDWQLARAAEKLGAVRLSEVNHAMLLAGPGEGSDGRYRVHGIWFNPRYHRSTPIGFVLERRGDEITALYAVPGASARIAGEEGTTYPVADLPKFLRAALRQVYLGVNGIKISDVGFDEAMSLVPDHLKPLQGDKEVEANGGTESEEGTE